MTNYAAIICEYYYHHWLYDYNSTIPSMDAYNNFRRYYAMSAPNRSSYIYFPHVSKRWIVPRNDTTHNHNS